MKNDIMSAGLTDILEQNGIDARALANGSGGHLQSIGPGLYRFVMPDGRWVVVDEFGRIVR